MIKNNSNPTTSMSSTNGTFKFGDSIVHLDRPEWGRGVVTRAESARLNGKQAQRIHVRFLHAGMKVLNTAAARVQQADSTNGVHAEKTTAVASKAGVSALGGAIPDVQLKRRPEESLLQLPDAADDPFTSTWHRLASTLRLYRFTRDPRAMTDWAIAQSGLDDPLAHFTRHELEAYFDRWAQIRDDHLRSLVTEAHRLDPHKLERLIAAAPPETTAALRYSNARR